MVRGTYWSDTTFTEPRPLLPDIAFGEGGLSYGLRLQSTTDYWWLSKPDGVWRAPRPAGDPLDLTNDILKLSLRADSSSSSLRGAERRGNLTIELDNSRGQYNQDVILSGANNLKRGSEIVLKLGYRTTQGDEAVEAGTYWVDGWQYSSTDNRSLFAVYCLDGWGLMGRWTARYQMRWNKDAVNPRSIWQIIYQLLARVGIKLSNAPVKPQSSAINNFYPDFAVNPGTQGTRALSRLLSFIPDQLVFRGQEAFTKDPLPAEASCYFYGAGAAGHPILSGEYREETCISHARALGQDEDGDRIVRDAFDWELLQLGIDMLEQVYDPNLRSASAAQERADALLSGVSLRAKRGNLLIPTNVGQELLDVVTVTDARCGISERPYRVRGIQTLYDRRQGQYEQMLTLGAP